MSAGLESCPNHVSAAKGFTFRLEAAQINPIYALIPPQLGITHTPNNIEGMTQ